MQKIKIFNGNAIKLIAAFTMLADHIGMLWGIIPFRYIGRLSMPLFAFMIAEGCYHTKNKFKHFACIFLLALICETTFIIFEPNYYHLSILTTFSISIALIYALDYFKSKLLNETARLSEKIFSGALFAAGVFLTYVVTRLIKTVNGKPFYIDYDFFGCLLPVFASLFTLPKDKTPEKLAFLNGSLVRLLSFTVGLTVLCLMLATPIEWFSMFSLIPIALYNAERGKLNLKYFFYIFYPAHLVILYGLSMII